MLGAQWRAEIGHVGFGLWVTSSRGSAPTGDLRKQDLGRRSGWRRWRSRASRPGCVCSRSIAGWQHGLPIAVLGAPRSLHSPGLWARPPAFCLCAEGRCLAHGVSLPGGSLRTRAWATKPSSLSLKLSFVQAPLCPQPHVSIFVLTFTCNLLRF